MPPFVKRDRTARLARIAHLLHQNSKHGLTVPDIARRIGMTTRTVYRDLRALEEEIGVPVWQLDGRWGAEVEAFLPPLNLTLLEAVTLFVSARLLARFSDKRDEHIISAFGKLSSILPAPVAEHVDATVADLAARPRNALYAQVFDTLAEGWAGGRRVRIWYPHVGGDGQTKVNERLVSPYFLEPYSTGHSCYLIAQDDLSGAIRTFKVERIQKAQATDETFDLPDGFDGPARLSHAWGITDEDPVNVRVLVSEPTAVSRIKESRWHPSQQETARPDGSLEVSFTVGGTTEIGPWILSWGSAMEVLEPPELRQRIGDTAKTLTARYS